MSSGPVRYTGIMKHIFFIILIALIIIFTPLVFSKESKGIEYIEPETEVDSEMEYAKVIAHAISLTESNGKSDCENMKGLSGEIGCHQFMPSTWRGYSIDVYGEIVEQTKENARYVAEMKVYEFLKKGYSEEEIFLIWNQGNRYKCKSGTNKYGVKYDSCLYVQKGLNNLNKIKTTG